MSRAYSKIICYICGESITSAGAPYVSHMRRHVRTGHTIEYKTRDGYVEFQNTYIPFPHDLTQSEIKALKIVRDKKPYCASHFAELMWPDSIMHTKHSKSGRGTQVGKAAWLTGGSYLGRLRKRGLVRVFPTWQRTSTDKPVAVLTTKGQIYLRSAEMEMK